METRKIDDYAYRLADLDKKIIGLHMQIIKLEREREKLDRSMMHEVEEEEQLI